jgi:hypothetical protein
MKFMPDAAAPPHRYPLPFHLTKYSLRPSRPAGVRHPSMLSTSCSPSQHSSQRGPPSSPCRSCAEEAGEGAQARRFSGRCCHWGGGDVRGGRRCEVGQNGQEEGWRTAGARLHAACMAQRAAGGAVQELARSCRLALAATAARAQPARFAALQGHGSAARVSGAGRWVSPMAQATKHEQRWEELPACKQRDILPAQPGGAPAAAGSLGRTRRPAAPRAAAGPGRTCGSHGRSCRTAASPCPVPAEKGR